MSEWTAEDRDAELQHIRRITTGVALGAVGTTIVLGVGVAWGDQLRIDQAAARGDLGSLPPGSVTPGSVTPGSATPGGTSLQAPTSPPTTGGSNSLTSRSGGS